MQLPWMQGYPLPPRPPHCPLHLPTTRRLQTPSRTVRVSLPIFSLSRSQSSNPLQARDILCFVPFLVNACIEALTILIQFYASQDSIPHVLSLGDVCPKLLHNTSRLKNHQIKPPTMSPSYPTLFGHLNSVTDQKEKRNSTLTPAPPKSQTPHPSAEGVLPKSQP